MKNLYILFFFFSFLLNWACSSTHNGKSKEAHLDSKNANVAENTPFEKEFVGFFKLAKLPYSVDTSLQIRDTIDAAKVVHHILNATQSIRR
jgi:hypothetical protein